VEDKAFMKIVLCGVQVPFVKGGAEYLCDNLFSEMIKRNYDIEYVKIPFKWYPPPEIISHSLIWKLMDLSESNGSKIDGVITTKFPSYLIHHQNNVVWLIHQHRSAYDKAYTHMTILFRMESPVRSFARKSVHWIINPLKQHEKCTPSLTM
jgi:hypothetical protein